MLNTSFDAKLKASVSQRWRAVIEWMMQPLTLRNLLLANVYGIVFGMIIGLIITGRYSESLFLVWMLSMTWWFNSYEDAA